MKTAVNKDNVQKQPLGLFLLLKTFTVIEIAIYARIQKILNDEKYI